MTFLIFFQNMVTYQVKMHLYVFTNQFTYTLELLIEVNMKFMILFYYDLMAEINCILVNFMFYKSYMVFNHVKVSKLVHQMPIYQFLDHRCFK